MVELKARFDEQREHPLGEEARAGGRPRRLRDPGAEDPRQVHPRRPPRGRRRPPLRPHRDRQLQPEDGAHLHRPRPLHRRPGDRRRHRRDVQLPDRLRAPAQLPQGAGRAVQPAEGILEEIERTIESHSPATPARIRLKMNSLLDAPSIRALYRASQAGVEVEINVRGICAPAPRRARRLGEHRGDLGRRPLPRALADLLVRAPRRGPERLHRLGRPDAAQPLQPRRAGRRRCSTTKVRAELVDVLDRSLADNTNSWELDSDGELDPAPAGRRAAQRPARADRAPHRALAPRAPRSSRRPSESRSRGAAAAMAERHDAHGYWLAEAGAGPSRRRALEGERRGRRRSSSAAATPGMWTAWHIKRLEPERPGRRCSRPGRCGHGPSGRNGGFVNGALVQPADAARALRRRAARSRSRGPPQASVDEIGEFCARAGHRRLVSPGRLPAGLDRAGLGRRLGAGRRGLRASSASPTRAEPLERRGGPRALRLAAVSRRRASIPAPRPCSRRGSRWGLRRAGARGRRRDLRAQPGRLGRPARRARSSPRPGAGRVSAGAAVLAPAARSPRFRRMRHRLTLTSSHMVITEPVPRPARGDRLDRRRVHHRLAGDGPLLPHHPRRPDRLRLGRRQGRLRRPHRRARRASTPT